MKKLILILICLTLGLNFNTFAGNKAGKKTDKMAVQLKLNKTEKAKILAVYKKYYASKEKIKANKKLSEEEKERQLDEIKATQKSELKAVIGDKRYDWYKDQKNKEKKKKKEGKEKKNIHN
jgi:hypothetical protein